MKAKSEVSFEMQPSRCLQGKKPPRTSIVELQEKISQYKQACELSSVRSEPKLLLEAAKSPEKSARLN